MELTVKVSTAPVHRASLAAIELVYVQAPAAISNDNKINLSLYVLFRFSYFFFFSFSTTITSSIQLNPSMASISLNLPIPPQIPNPSSGYSKLSIRSGYPTPPCFLTLSITLITASLSSSPHLSLSNFPSRIQRAHSSASQNMPVGVKSAYVSHITQHTTLCGGGLPCPPPGIVWNLSTIWWENEPG
jgi:hypothetical protein